MVKVLIIARKEIKEVFKTRSTIILGLVFAGFFAFMYSQNIIGENENLVNGAIFFLSLSIAIFTAYTTTAQIFLLEKREGVIETLMCAPVTLRQIWAGKTAAGVVPSWLISLFAAIMVIVISGIRLKTVLIPNIAVIVNLLIVVPVFVSAFVGLVGFGQLILGMKENRLLNFIIFIPAFAALYGSGFAIASTIDVSWLHVGIALGIALVLLGLGTWLTGFLNRERIVTTIE